MLTFDVKRKINNLRDILVGKVPDPKAQVEQITIALIYKFMDDMDIEGVEFGGNREFFTGDYEKYAFSKIMSPENSGQERAILYAEGIDKMALNPQLPQLFRDIFRGAYLPYRDPETLNLFLKEIAEFKYDNSEDLGNAFEYLLSIMGSQGDAGQFRTPRHIIDMIVKIVDPKKNETILDPACGTAGFLISAYKHILESNKDEDGNSTLTADDRKRLTNNFEGYDISPDMVRLSRVNMYLHHFTKPKISEYDTLTSEDKWDDNFDVILANPPFMTPKGGIIPHGRYRVKAKRSEVLFVDYIAEHLNPNGRAGIVVPEGIVFQNATAYRELRKYLVDEGLLYAVISLPAGVFNPYSGVKTSILLIDKALARQSNDILFLKMNNDGFDLGAQRREIKQNDIPFIFEAIHLYKQGKDISDNDLALVVSKEEIREKQYILVGEKYKKETVQFGGWPMIQLGDMCEIIRGTSITKRDLIEGSIPVVAGGQKPAYYHNASNRTGKVITISGSGAYAGFVNYFECPIFASDCSTIQSNNENVDLEYIYYVLKFKQNEIYSLQSGMGQPHVYAKDIRQLKIPLPPLAVQQEILSDIHQYKKIIDGAQQIVDNYKPFIKVDSSWDCVDVGEMYDISYGVTISIPQNEDENGIKIISTAEVGLDGQLDLSEIRKVRYERKYEKFVLEPDTLLFNWRNAPKHVGKTAWFLHEDDRYISASFLLSLKNKNPNCYDNGFVWCALNNLRETGYFMRNARQAVNQSNFNGDQLAKTKLRMPDIDEQKRIMATIYEEMTIVEQNKRLIQIFEAKIKDRIAEVWGE